MASTRSIERTGVVLVGHGSRRRRGNSAFEALVRQFAEQRPEYEVGHGYIELARPTLDDALAEMASRCSRVVAIPVLLFAAGHAKNDLPLALSRARHRFPDVRFEAARWLGQDAGLTRLALQRIEECLDGADAAETSVLVVGRGSSDPDANGEFAKVARLIAEGGSFERVERTHLGITDPRFAESMRWLGHSRPRRIIVLPYLLFPGRLIESLQSAADEFAERHSWIDVRVADPLGVEPAVIQAISDRIDQAEAGLPLPCDGCRYRVEIPGHVEHKGGLRALLWSFRHSYTHSQASPHEHAHPPLRRHLLVCANADCADRGSIELLNELRKRVRETGLRKEVQVTRTSCLGRCGEGPAVAVYPDGIWYREVAPSDAAELFHEHVLNDRLLSSRVDNIMQ